MFFADAALAAMMSLIGFLFLDHAIRDRRHLPLGTVISQSGYGLSCLAGAAALFLAALELIA